VAIDPLLARVQVAVTLDPTDICYGFYPYQEPDIVYTDLDVNPFTNQNVRNRIVQFYFKPHSADPFRTIFYQILNNDGTVFLTNDPDPGYPTGDSGVIFGSMVVGTSRGVQSFETTDIRNRGPRSPVAIDPRSHQLLGSGLARRQALSPGAHTICLSTVRD
jgi:hypothetical protein